MEKKFTALFCIFALLVGMLAGCGSSEQSKPAQQEPPAQTQAIVEQDDASADTFTVHAYVPQSWTEIGIWAWSDTEGNLFEAWPGEAMKADGNGWYTYELPGWVSYVIVNGNEGAVQTADLSVEAKDVWIVVNEDESCQISYTEITDPGTADGAVIENESDYYTVYAKVPSSWYNAGIWAWSDTEGDLFEAWPGYELLMGDDGWYYFELPNWINYVIISGNDGNVQTADIPVEAKDLWIVIRDDLSYSLSYQSGDAASAQTGSSAYDEVFSRCGLTDTSLVYSGLKCYSFAMAEGTDTVMKLEFGCADGITRELGWVMYFRTAGTSAEELEAADQAVRETYGAMLESVDCCTVTYRQLTNYYCISILFTGLDDMDNVNETRAVLGELAGVSMGVDSYIPEPSRDEFTKIGFIAK